MIIGRPSSNPILTSSFRLLNARSIVALKFELEIRRLEHELIQHQQETARLRNLIECQRAQLTALSASTSTSYSDLMNAQHRLAQEISSLKKALENRPSISVDGSYVWKITGWNEKKSMYVLKVCLLFVSFMYRKCLNEWARVNHFPLVLLVSDRL